MWVTQNNFLWMIFSLFVFLWKIIERYTSYILIQEEKIRILWSDCVLTCWWMRWFTMKSQTCLHKMLKNTYLYWVHYLVGMWKIGQGKMLWYQDMEVKNLHIAYGVDLAFWIVTAGYSLQIYLMKQTLRWWVWIGRGQLIPPRHRKVLNTLKIC